MMNTDPTNEAKYEKLNLFIIPYRLYEECVKGFFLQPGVKSLQIDSILTATREIYIQKTADIQFLMAVSKICT